MKNRLYGMCVFAKVVDVGSFTVAAEKLGISKSMASRHVSMLEQSLAVKLLNRSTRKLSLTEAGNLFYEHCAAIVKEAELAEQRLIRTQTEPAGLIRITAVPAFAVRHLIPAFAEFYQKFPEIKIKLSCSNQALDLGDEGFDLGIRVSFNPDQNLVARKLAANRATLCATPKYLERNGIPKEIEELRKHSCVLFTAISPTGVWTLKRDQQAFSVPVTGVIETDEMDLVYSAVLAGLGIGILPVYMVGEAIQNKQLVPLLRQYQVVPESAIYLVYLPNRTLSSRVRVLIDFLVARFKPIATWEKDW
jgi:DNA-binding transcriptional LysR family regulator